jgi:hypothetical protein
MSDIDGVLRMAIDRAALSNAAFKCDRENRMLRHVRLMSRGRMYPVTGKYGVYEIDDVSIEQGRAAVSAARGGLKCRFTHPELTAMAGASADDLGHRLGRVINPTVENGDLYGDVRIAKYADSSPMGPLGQYVMDMADEEPEGFGLSLQVLESEAELDMESVAHLRIRAATACDVVGEPASNPNGLLSRAPRAPGAPGGAPGAPEPKPDAEPDTTDEPPGGDPADKPAACEDTTMSKIAPQGTGDAAPPAGGPPSEPAPAVPAQVPAAAVADAGAPQAVTMSAGQLTAHVLNMSRQHGLEDGWADAVLASGRAVTVDALNAAALDAIARRNPPRSTGASNVQVGEDLNMATLAADMEDALLLRSGNGQLHVVDMMTMQARPREPRPRALQFARHDWLHMGRQWMATLGFRNAFDLDRETVARSMLLNKWELRDRFPTLNMAAGVSDWGEITRDAINKAAAAQYLLAPPKWPLIAQRRLANDFRDLWTIRVSDAPLLIDLTEKMELQFPDILSDASERYRVIRQAGGMRVTFQAILADDLGVFSTIPNRLVQGAKQAEDKKVFSLLAGGAATAMRDSYYVFSSQHSNLLSATGDVGAPSVVTLNKAQKKLRRATGPKGNYLDLPLAFVVVPPALEGVTVQLAGSDYEPLASTGTTHMGNNIWKGRFTPVVSPFLEDSGVTGYSSTAWYALADYRQGAVSTIEIAFIRGYEAPQVEIERQFGTGDFKIAVVHAFGAQVAEYRGMVKNNGA